MKLVVMDGFNEVRKESPVEEGRENAFMYEGKAKEGSVVRE